MRSKILTNLHQAKLTMLPTDTVKQVMVVYTENVIIYSFLYICLKQLPNPTFQSGLSAKPMQSNRGFKIDTLAVKVYMYLSLSVTACKW